MVDVDHRLFAQGAQRLRLDNEDFAPQRLLDAHALRRELAVGRRVRAQLKESVMILAHAARLPNSFCAPAFMPSRAASKRDGFRSEERRDAAGDRESPFGQLGM